MAGGISRRRASARCLAMGSSDRGSKPSTALSVARVNAVANFKVVTRQEGLRAARPASQRGQVVVLMLLVVFLGVGYLLYSMAGNRSAKYNRQAKTDAALAIARDAL